MNMKSIKTKADYRAVLKEIEPLMRAAPRSAEGERLDVLVTLVECYEKTHFSLELPDPVCAARFDGCSFIRVVHGKPEVQDSIDTNVFINSEHPLRILVIYDGPRSAD